MPHFVELAVILVAFCLLMFGARTRCLYYDRSADEAAKEVEPDNRVKAFRYGKELFPVGAADEALMKYESERCLTVLCFTPAAKLPRECVSSFNCCCFHDESSHACLSRH